MRCYILIGLFLVLFSLFVKAETTFNLTSNNCSFAFEDFKLKANYTIGANGSLDNKKYGCKSCFNNITNTTNPCEPCYLEKNGTFPVLPLEEYVKVTQTNLDYKTDRVLLNNKFESFKIAQQNLTVVFPNETTLNNTIIGFKEGDNICIYDTTQKYLKCSSFNGFICNSTQKCFGSLLQVDDSSSCCSEACGGLNEQPKTENLGNKSEGARVDEGAVKSGEEINSSQPDVVRIELTQQTSEPTILNKTVLIVAGIIFFIVVLATVFLIIFFIKKKKEEPEEPKDLW